MRIYMNVKYNYMHIHNKIKSVNSEKKTKQKYTVLRKKLNVYELKENTTALSSNVHESKKMSLVSHTPV